MSAEIYFYIPKIFWPDPLPATGAENWSGFGLGMYAWTLQTYLRLRAAGFDCELTPQLPDEGIVLFHSNVARAQAMRPGPKRLLICLKAESPLCPQAQLHVVQNPREISWPGCYFMPHWPQPGLQPRLLDRNDRFETIAFFGHRNSLAPQLLGPDWPVQLQKRGLRWLAVVNNNAWHRHDTLDTRWNDYRHVDAVVAVRQFNLRQPGYGSKPATKLYNAWLAGVPAILGREQAYRAEGQANYLEVNSMEELLACVDRLRRDRRGRQRLVKRGYRRALQYAPEVITQRWRRFLLEVALPAYEAWRGASRWQRRAQQSQAYVLHHCDRTRRRLMP